VGNHFLSVGNHFLSVGGQYTKANNVFLYGIFIIFVL